MFLFTCSFLLKGGTLYSLLATSGGRSSPKGRQPTVTNRLPKYVHSGARDSYACPSPQALGAEGGKPSPVAKDDLIRKGERMKVTKKGLCFSGISSYISNMAYFEINFNNRSFKSNEQSIQWTKAMDHNDPELAAEKYQGLVGCKVCRRHHDDY